MPDADDFDIESLRALLRGESPAPAKYTRQKSDSGPKPTRAATRGKASAKETKASPSAPRGAKGPKSTPPAKRPRKP